MYAKGKARKQADLPPTPSTAGPTVSTPSEGSNDVASGDEHDFQDAQEDVHIVPIMTDYDVADETDLKDAALEARSIQLKFDRKDIKAWLQRLEIRLEFVGVKSQWLKRLCLENVLPEDIAHCCNEYFVKTKTNAGAHIYKDCKVRLLKVHGPKPEEDVKKALGYVLTGPPSEGAKDLAQLICTKDKKLTDCCCAKTVGALWRELLHPTVRAAVAGLDLKTQFDQVVEKADQVQDTIKTAPAVAATTATGTRPKTTQKPADLDTSADAPALDQNPTLVEQVAALNKQVKALKKPFKGKGGRGAQQNRGGAAGRPQPRRGTNPHPDGPPDNACDIHWRFGRSAFYCLAPSQCPWSHITNPQK